MTKTPEELTEDWLNNKLQAGSFWFVETEGDSPEPMVVDIDGDFNDYSGNYYRPCFSKGKLKVLAPCDYDEHKAMQTELAELKEKVSDQRADLQSSRWYQTVQNEDIGKLRGLLKECKSFLEYAHPIEDISVFEGIEDLLTRINAALGESEENADMLKNADNFNTSAGNVKENNR